MTEDQYPEMQFPDASIFARAFAVVMCGLVGLIFLASIGIRKWKRPLPDSLVGWIVDITVDSVILASFYAMVNFCIWAIIFTPRAEYLLVKRLTRVFYWGIALVTVVIVVLFGARP